METSEHRFTATEQAGEVSALLVRPPAARCALVLAHGAGAGMRHRFMDAIVRRLAEQDVATYRYQFPYTEQGRRRPDPAPVLTDTVRAAVTAAGSLLGDLPLFAGGKSMGGRMTSMAMSKQPIPCVCGLVFFGFPLHPAGRPGIERARHLGEVTVPMLFLQGTRDKLADLELLTPVCQELGDRAVLHVMEGADHAFDVLKRSGTTAEQVLGELAETVATWATSVGRREQGA